MVPLVKGLMVAVVMDEFAKKNPNAVDPVGSGVSI